jgi:hypothetical protein
MKTLIILSLLLFNHCRFTSDLDAAKLDFLSNFEKILEINYGASTSEANFRKFIAENWEAFQENQLVRLDGIEDLLKHELVKILWLPVKQNGSVVYYLDFDGWYCDFINGLESEFPWVNEYQENVCSAKDITPTATYLFASKAHLLNLKDEKMRFWVAVHYYSLWIVYR